MSVPLIDEFALRTIGSVAEHGDNSHLRACREILCPLFRFIYGKGFRKILGFSAAEGHERHESLSRFTSACARVFVYLEVCESTPTVTADLRLTGGRVCLTTYTHNTRCVQLMLTAAPCRILGTCKRSYLEVIDVDRVTRIRFLIWTGKQLTAKMGSAFLDIFQVEILPRVLDEKKLSCKQQRVLDVPLTLIRDAKALRHL